MNKKYLAFKLFGLEIRIYPSAGLVTLALWVIFGVISALLFDFSIVQAIITGLIGAAVHWLSVLVHHLGHAFAAARTGYPMRLVRTYGPLAASIYPRDEGELPARLHIRRAIGGPIFSGALGIIGAILFFGLRDSGDFITWTLGLVAAINLFVFTIGALLPNPIIETDGMTIMKYWSERNA